MLHPEFRALRSELQALYRHPDATRQLLELAAHVAMMLAGGALFFAVDAPWLRLAGVLLSALGCLGISTSSHTASHDALLRSRRGNRLLVQLGFPFLLMVSATYWYHKHLVVHHPAPNVIGVDEDVNLAPFAFSRDDQRGGWLRRWLLRWQGLLFPLALALNAFNVQRQGVVFLARKLWSRRRKARHWRDLGLMLLHVAAFYAAPMAAFGVTEVLGFHLLRSALLGYLIFAALGAAHFPAEAAAVDPSQLRGDHVLLQTATTVNFKAGPFGRLLCAGVDYQIEHHLFPGLGHTHYRRMAPQVEAFCRAHGYPYRVMSWRAAVWKSLRAMATPRPVVRDLKDLRLAGEAPRTRRA
jgi:linoleoyl-CoA desaturase